MEVKCPVCEKKQEQNPIKTWVYGKIIAKRTKKETTWKDYVKCSHYSCNCGKSFNLYLTSKGKFWTIPKPKKNYT